MRPATRRVLTAAAVTSWLAAVAGGGLLAAAAVARGRVGAALLIGIVVAGLAACTLTVGLWLDQAGRRALTPVPIQTALDVGIKLGMRIAQTAQTAQHGPLQEDDDPFTRLMTRSLLHDLGVQQDDHTPPAGQRRL